VQVQKAQWVNGGTAEWRGRQQQLQRQRGSAAGRQASAAQRSTQQQGLQRPTPPTHLHLRLCLLQLALELTLQRLLRLVQLGILLCHSRGNRHLQQGQVMQQLRATHDMPCLQWCCTVPASLTTASGLAAAAGVHDAGATAHLDALLGI
jgi:hypothetical protein